MPVPLWAKAVMIGIFVVAIIVAVLWGRKSYRWGFKKGEEWKRKHDEKQK